MRANEHNKSWTLKFSVLLNTYNKVTIAKTKNNPKITFVGEGKTLNWCNSILASKLMGKLKTALVSPL